MGFLYTPMVSVPSGAGVIMMSKKAMATSGLVSSTVNCMALSVEFMGCRHLSLCWSSG